jgi:hypothetical protein
MWPEAKGKSKDNKPDKPGKNRATKAKIKAMSKEAAEQMVKAAQEEQAALDALAAQARAESEAELSLKYESAKQDTNPDMVRPDLIKLPASAGERNDDKIASVWKSRMMGNMRPAAQDPQVQTGPRQALENNERMRINAQHEVMINHVDKMFDHFQNLAYDFNQMNPAAELELTWIRPTVTRENISSWHQSAQYISVFTGRISTRFWTLVVRGTFEGILAYIIPADKLLAFTTQPTQYVCAVEFVPYDTGHGLVFGAEGQALTEGQLALTYRALLEALITVAQENVLTGRLNLHALGVFDGGVPSQAPLGQVEVQAAASSNADIDYSAKYKQHMADSQTLSTNSFQSTSNSGEFFQDGDQYKSSNSYPPEFSVNNIQNQSQSGSFQGPAAPLPLPGASAPLPVSPAPSNYQSQSGQFGTQSQSGSFGTTPAASQSDDDWKPVAQPGRGFGQSLAAMADGTATSSSNASVGGAPNAAREPAKGGFSADALFQNVQNSMPPQMPQSIAQAISQTISQGNPQVQSGQQPQSIAQAISQNISQGNPQVPQGQQPPAPPAKDVPWNFMPTKVDPARSALGTSASHPVVPASQASNSANSGATARSTIPNLPPLPPLPSSAQMPQPEPPSVVPPVSPLELLGQVDIMSSPNKFGYTRPAPPPPLPPRQDSSAVSNVGNLAESSDTAQNDTAPEIVSASSNQPEQAEQAEVSEFAMPDSLQVTNMAFLIANEPVSPVLDQPASAVPDSFPTAPMSGDVTHGDATQGDFTQGDPVAAVPSTYDGQSIDTQSALEQLAVTADLVTSDSLPASSEAAALTSIEADLPAQINDSTASELAAPAPDESAVFSFRHKLDQVLDYFDREMEAVAQRGSEAFAKRDLKKAESMIKLAEEIGELKEALTKFKEQHQDELS